MKAHVNLTDRPLGPYTAVLKVSTADVAMETLAEVEMDLKHLLTHRQHLDNAIDALRDRMFSDAVCGHCETCQDVRMVDMDVRGNGRVENVYCPVCHPKLEAAREVLRTGLETS